MTPKRCEPPEELRDENGWHWLVEDDGQFSCFFWGAQYAWWLYTTDPLDPVSMSELGYRYHAPVAPPPKHPWPR